MTERYQRGGSAIDQILAYVKDTHAMVNPAGGRIFYQDKTRGDDSAANPGTAYYTPLLTIKQALTKCVAGRRDWILVLDNSPSTPPATEDFPIVMNKANVKLIGTLSDGSLSDSGIGSDTQDVNTFEIAASYVTIQDMYIGCDNLGNTGALVSFNGANNYFSTTFRRCIFDTQHVAAYGIYAQFDQPYLLVEDCIYGRSDIGGFSTAAVYIGNLTAGMLRRNVYRKVAGIGISVGAGAHNFTILDERFDLPSNTKGKAITLADGSSGIFVDGCRANFGQAAMVANPFLDLNNDTSNTWGLNYKAGTSVMPDNAA